MLFAGELSLENNGGFASIRSSGKTEDLGEFDGISIRVRGDGRRYYFTIQTDFLIFAGSYRSGFDTVAGQWTEIRLPFKSFQANSFGRPLGSAPALNKRQVRSLGILLADKKAGPFELEIDWIRAYRGEDQSEVNQPEKGGYHDTAQTGVKGTEL
jgi:monofunctional biosynthetic peptidoglycan transglycosylase